MSGDVQQSGEIIHYEFGIRNIYDAIVARKTWLIASVALCLVAGVAYAVLKKPVYRAETVLVFVDSQNQAPVGAGLLSKLGGLGGLAALTGFALDGVGSGGKHEAIATLKSRSFLDKFIGRHDLLPILFADDWNAEAGEWEVDEPEDIPSISQAYLKFTEDVFRLQDDTLTGLLTVSIEWTDPELAAAWANLLVSDVNERLKDKAIQEAQKSLGYLNRELQKAQAVELEQSIYSLIEEQIKRIMLASVRDEYAFRVLDPAIAPEKDEFIRPNRILAVLVALTLGLLVGMALSIVRHSVR